MFNKTKTRSKLDTDQILQKEFDYIAQTVFQANEDRSRFTSFYLVSIGSLVAAIVGTRLEDGSRIVSFAFFILFLVLTAMGTLTIAQLARLRVAWYESVKAMNKIKDFYISHHPEIEEAFLWRDSGIPKLNSPGSIANLTSLEVAILSALTAGAGLYFLFSYIGSLGLAGWLVIVTGTVFSGFALWSYYLHLLSGKG